MSDGADPLLDSVAGDPLAALQLAMDKAKAAEGAIEQARAAAEVTELAEAAKILQGPPVAVLKGDEAPNEGFASLRDWATKLFEEAGGVAVNPRIGEVVLDGRSVRDSMAHKITRHKAAAFAAVQRVIEGGAVIAKGAHDDRSGVVSYYISAPVDIGEMADVVTVLVRRDEQTQRMYLHSVATKKNLLQPQESGSGWGGPPDLSGTLAAGDVRRILHHALTVQPGDKPVLDRVGDVAFPLERLKIARELGVLAEQLKDHAGMSALERLKVARQIRALLERLGAIAGGVSPEVRRQAAALRSIAAGMRDSETLAEIYGLMQEAIGALEEAGALKGDAQTAAQEAITHWAELEEKTNG